MQFDDESKELAIVSRETTMHDDVSIGVSKLAHCHGDCIEGFVSNLFVIGCCWRTFDIPFTMAREFGIESNQNQLGTQNGFALILNPKL